jgi:NAD-dependent deacetylase
MSDNKSPFQIKYMQANTDEQLSLIALIIKKSKFLTVFTGAGISKDSGIPVFRGRDGLYDKYNPQHLEIGFFLRNASKSWTSIKEIFYDNLGAASPNDAHKILAQWEKDGLVKTIITQNIDNLHQSAGSKNVVCFHGSTDKFVCTICKTTYSLCEIKIDSEVPLCKKCNSTLKPGFVFFGEPIPAEASANAFSDAKRTDVHIIIGTTGEVHPASLVPQYAKNAGAIIIEINPEKSSFTDTITDYFINLKAVDALTRLNNIIKKVS